MYSVVVCKRLPVTLKEKNYMVVVRPIMLNEVIVGSLRRHKCERWTCANDDAEVQIKFSEEIGGAMYLI